MKSHFDVIAEALREHAGGSWFTVAANDVETALRDAGYIIVRRGAIGEAQREAVAQWREDNDNRREVRPVADMVLRLLGS